ARVTAMGCAGAAITAAFLAVAEDPFEATGAAMLTLGIAGELAAETARGPGSFAAAYLDALYGLDTLELASQARIDTSPCGDLP
ncbi:MAG: hydroxyethylthiazole kinase, partial [Phreatobacter sp.]|nr:hydroxyethylthiazole kinase [Phreatobacter sp.]